MFRGRKGEEEGTVLPLGGWNRTRAARRAAPSQVEMTDEEVEVALKEGPLKNLDLNNCVASPKSIATLKRMMLRYKRVFDVSEPGTRVKGYTAKVDIVPGASPAQARVFSFGPVLDKATREWIREMIANDSREPIRSPWRAGVVCVPKGSGHRI